MKTYKIKNITHELGARDANYNKQLDIEYLDGIFKKTYKLKPNETIHISTRDLCMSTHDLRIKGFIIVDLVKGIKPKSSIKIKQKTKEIVNKVVKETKIQTRKPQKKQNKTEETGIDMVE